MKLHVGSTLLLTLCILGMSSGALGQTFTTYGKIGTIQVLNSGNMPFRVSFANGQGICGSASGEWAYLNEADASYKLWVATLIAARVSESYVSLQASLDSQSYCRIGNVLWTTSQ